MGNFCCVDFQTNCKKSITIGYLKSLVNGAIPINTGANPKFADDDYCPTYSELTGGTLIAQYVDGGAGHWNDNVDGIEVESIYSQDSVVNKEDVAFYYTTPGELVISAEKTQFNECGDSTIMQHTCGLTKLIKRINSDCEIIVSTTYGSDESISPTFRSNQLWTTISDNQVSATKNGTVSSTTRNVQITAKAIVRGEEQTSNAVTITQNALTGDYETNGTKSITSFTTQPTPSTRTVGCEGGNIRMDYTIVVNERRYWIDSCETKYVNIYEDEQETISGFVSDSFSEIECPITSYTEQKTLSYTYSGQTKAITFEQNCYQPDSCCSRTGYTCTTECRTDPIIVSKCGYSDSFSVDVYSYCAEPEDLSSMVPYNDYVVTWEHVSGTDDFVTFNGSKNLTWNAASNCVGNARTAKYVRYIKTSDSSITIQSCTYTFTQAAERCETCECDCGVLSFDKELNYYYTNQIPREGGSFNYVYSFAPCSGDKNVTFSKGNAGDTWYTLTNDTLDNKLTVTVNPRTSASSGTAEINILVNNDDNCGKVIKFKQQEGCQCSNATQSIISEIPRGGMTSGSSIGSYSITNYCDNYITFESTDLSIVTGNGIISLSANVLENISDYNKEFHIVKKLYNEACGEPFVITQSGLLCSCEDLHVTLNTIPQQGLSANSIIGTYTVDGDCEIKTTLSSTDLSISYGNGIITTTNAIPANDGEDEITYVISGKVGDSKATYTTTQPGLECNCEDLNISLNSIPRKGLSANTQIGTYSATSVDCMDKVTLTSSNNITIDYSSGSIKTRYAIPVNDGEDEITYSISGKVRTHDCEGETSTTTQPGLACNCRGLSVLLNSIPRAGLSANAQIGTYSMSNEDCMDKVTLTSSNNITISYSNGVIRTANLIPANDDEDEITYTISGKVRTDDCEVAYTTTQPGLACNCSGMTTSFAIPQGGLQINSIIGTYSFDNGDCLDKASFTSNDLSISYNSGTVITTSAISANKDENPKTYTINRKVRTEDCSPIVISQPGLACSCANLSKFMPTIVEVPRSGYASSTKIGEYTINNTCEEFLSISGTGGITITKSSGDIMVSGISANTTPSSKSYTISARVRGGEPCASFTITQAAGCNCDDLTSFSVKPIPNRGAGTSFVLGTYAISNDCSSKVSFSSSTLNIRYEAGNIYPQSSIPANDNDYAITHAISASVNSVYCETKNVNQPGLACDCGSVTINNALSDAIIPRSGYTAHTKIATYTVSDGCESKLSFSSNSSNFIISANTANNTVYAKVSANTSTSVAQYTLTPCISGSACNTDSLTYNQQAECDCRNVTVTKTLSSNIPRSGYTAFTQIATYTVSDGCESKVSFSSNSANFVISASTTNKTIYATVTSIVDTDNDSRTFKFVPLINGNVACSEVEYTQQADCKCTNLTVTKTRIADVPRSGFTAFTKVAEYNTSDGCNSVVHFTSDSSACTLSAYNGNAYAKFTSNELPTAVTHNVYYKLYERERECGHLSFIQSAGCNCTDLSSLVTNNIPAAGASTGYKISSYSISNECASKLSFSCNTLSLTWANGDLKLNQNVPFNDGDSANSHTISASVNNVYCESKTITQPALDCDCESISFTKTYNNNIPRSGFTSYTEVARYSDGGSGCNHKLVINSGTSLCSFSGNNGVVYAKVSANTSPTSEQFNLSYSVDDSQNCPNMPFTQDAGCNCNDDAPTLTFNTTKFPNGIIPSSGISNEVVYYKDFGNDSFECYDKYAVSGDGTWTVTKNYARNRLEIIGTINQSAEGGNYKFQARMNDQTCNDELYTVTQETNYCLNINISGETVSSLPASGGTVDLATYTCAPSMVESDFSASTNNRDFQAGLKFDIISKTLTVSLHGNANRTSLPISVDAYLYVKGGLCETITVTQSKYECNCSNIGILTAGNDLPSSGATAGTVVATYTHSDSICSDTAVTFSSTTMDVKRSGNTVVLNSALSGNALTTPVTHTINVYHDSKNTPCSSVTITQAASYQCSCKDINVELNVIPSSGLSANTIIGTITAQCGCTYTNFAFKNVSLSPERAYSASVTSTGKIIVTEQIPRNETDMAYTFSVTFMVGSNPCVVYTAQEAVEYSCDCSNKDSFIAPIKVMYPLSGTGNNYILAASGNTHGCGILTASGGTGLFDIRTENRENGDYYFYIKVLSGTTDNASTLNILFKKNSTSAPESCTDEVTIYRRSILYDCDNIIFTLSENLGVNNWIYDVNCFYPSGMTDSYFYVKNTNFNGNNDERTFIESHVTLDVYDEEGTVRYRFPTDFVVDKYTAHEWRFKTRNNGLYFPLCLASGTTRTSESACTRICSGVTKINGIKCSNILTTVKRRAKTRIDKPCGIYYSLLADNSTSSFSKQLGNYLVNDVAPSGYTRSVSRAVKCGSQTWKYPTTLQHDKPLSAYTGCDIPSYPAEWGNYKIQLEVESPSQIPDPTSNITDIKFSGSSIVVELSENQSSSAVSNCICVREKLIDATKNNDNVVCTGLLEKFEIIQSACTEDLIDYNDCNSILSAFNFSGSTCDSLRDGITAHGVHLGWLTEIGNNAYSADSQNFKNLSLSFDVHDLKNSGNIIASGTTKLKLPDYTFVYLAPQDIEGYISKSSASVETTTSIDQGKECSRNISAYNWNFIVTAVTTSSGKTCLVTSSNAVCDGCRVYGELYDCTDTEFDVSCNDYPFDFNSISGGTNPITITRDQFYNNQSFKVATFNKKTYFDNQYANQYFIVDTSNSQNDGYLSGSPITAISGTTGEVFINFNHGIPQYSTYTISLNFIVYKKERSTGDVDKTNWCESKTLNVNFVENP